MFNCAALSNVARIYELVNSSFTGPSVRLCSELLQILKYKQATVGKKGEAQLKALQTCYR